MKVSKTPGAFYIENIKRSKYNILKNAQTHGVLICPLWMGIKKIAKNNPLMIQSLSGYIKLHNGNWSTEVWEIQQVKTAEHSDVTACMNYLFTKTHNCTWPSSVLTKQVHLQSGARLSLRKEAVERHWSSHCGQSQASPPRTAFKWSWYCKYLMQWETKTLGKVNNTSTTAVSPQKWFGHEDSGERSKANVDQSWDLYMTPK